MFEKLSPQTILLVSLLPFFSQLIRKHSDLDREMGSEDTAKFGSAWSALCLASFLACLLVSLIRVAWWAPFVLSVTAFVVFNVFYLLVVWSGKWGSTGVLAIVGWPFVAYFALRALL